MKALFEEVRYFWSFLSEIFGLSASLPGDSESFRLLLAVPHAQLCSIHWGEFFKKSNIWHPEFLNFVIKIKDNFLSFSVVQGTLLLSIHIIGIQDISTFSRILRCVLLTSTCHFCISLFFSKISSCQYTIKHRTG